MNSSGSAQNLGSSRGRETLTYVLVVSREERAQVRKFLTSEGIENAGTSHPTLMVLDQDDEVVGVMGTIPSADAVIAGPLVIKSDRPRFMTVMRLVEAYDILMKSSGIKTYYFQTTGRLRAQVEKLGFTPTYEEGGVAYYKRDL